MAVLRDQRTIRTWAIKVSEFKFEVRSDLEGHLKASDATKMAVRGNMHTDTRFLRLWILKLRPNVIFEAVEAKFVYSL